MFLTLTFFRTVKLFWSDTVMTRVFGVSVVSIIKMVTGVAMGVITSVATTTAGAGQVGDDAGITMILS